MSKCSPQGFQLLPASLNIMSMEQHLCLLRPAAEFHYLESIGHQEETHANATALPVEYMVPFVIIISLTADAFIQDKLRNAGSALCILLI